MERIRPWPAAARRRLARASLFTSVTFAIVTGASIAVIVSFAIGIALHTKLGAEPPAPSAGPPAPSAGRPAPSAGTPAPIDVLKTALTVVAGVGGAVALVVAYRRQRDLEQGRFVERFGAAAAQLGNPDVAVRIAGVYAMAGVADESGGDFARRQQCIDVLCGYLRLPYEAEHGSSHRTEQVTTTTRQARPPITTIADEVHELLRQNDREVRQTIVRIMVSHLQSYAEANWSDHDFDFTGVYFEDASFENALFGGKLTSFNRATFSGENTSFAHATFSSNRTFFSDATFSSRLTSFLGATFTTGSNFNDQVTFEKATFSGLSTGFEQTRFGGKYITFHEATFGSTYTNFYDSTFSSNLNNFSGATFGSHHTSFEKVIFNALYYTDFALAKFTGASASFEDATFEAETKFVNASGLKVVHYLPAKYRQEFRDNSRGSGDT